MESHLLLIYSFRASTESPCGCYEKVHDDILFPSLSRYCAPVQARVERSLILIWQFWKWTLTMIPTVLARVDNHNSIWNASGPQQQGIWCSSLTWMIAIIFCWCNENTVRPTGRKKDLGRLCIHCGFYASWNRPKFHQNAAAGPALTCQKHINTLPFLHPDQHSFCHPAKNSHRGPVIYSNQLAYNWSVLSTSRTTKSGKVQCWWHLGKLCKLDNWCSGIACRMLVWKTEWQYLCTQPDALQLCNPWQRWQCLETQNPLVWTKIWNLSRKWRISFILAHLGYDLSDYIGLTGSSRRIKLEPLSSSYDCCSSCCIRVHWVRMIFIHFEHSS